MEGWPDYIPSPVLCPPSPCSAPRGPHLPSPVEEVDALRRATADQLGVTLVERRRHSAGGQCTAPFLRRCSR
eukprot:scaffold7039_cov118-Isochrysis_galbana.AAC.1